MSFPISELSRAILARSLPLVRQHQDVLIDRMEERLPRSETESEASAMILVGLLLDRVRNLVETGKFGALEGVADEHRALDIDGRHYSRFGDALVPILKDTLGPNLPREVPMAWGDAFWAIIHAAQPERELSPA